jgi:hypothetical protein
VGSPFSRRQFLAASAGLVAVAACGKSGEPDVSVKPTTESKDLSIVLGVDPNAKSVIAGVEERVAFLAFQGQTPTVEHPAEVGFAQGANGAYGESVRAEAHKDGIETRPYYVVRHTFPAPGLYRLGVNIAGGSAETPLQVVAASEVVTPVQGRAMPSVKTPTVADPMGVNPICTRSPACPWHDVSLDAALAEKKPVAFYVGTPARCETKTCGPVLDVLLSQKAAFESRVRFVHLEVYKTLTGAETIPAIDQLHLESEPWLFLIGPDGNVRERFAGPVDRIEAAAALTRLVG